MLKLLIKGHERVAAGGRMELLLLLLLLLLMLLLVRRPVASRWTKAAWENFLKKIAPARHLESPCCPALHPSSSIAKFVLDAKVKGREEGWGGNSGRRWGAEGAHRRLCR